MRCWRRLLSSPPRGAASSFLARARGSRVAEHPSELSFAKGDTLTVLGEAPKGWVRAARGADQTQIGLVPATFLEKVETRALVRPRDNDVKFVRCIACGQSLDPAAALLCGGCFAVSYCSAECASRHAVNGHTAADCEEHARYMRTDVSVKLGADDAPRPRWLATAMGHRSDIGLRETLEAMGVFCPTDPQSPYRVLSGCAPFDSVAALTSASELGAAFAAAAARTAEAPAVGVDDWASYYSHRGLSVDSPLATLLTFPLTVYHVLRTVGLDRRAGGLDERPIRVHLLGAEKELAFSPLFAEVARLLPAGENEAVGGRSGVEVDMVCGGTVDAEALSRLSAAAERATAACDGRVAVRAVGGDGKWYHDVADGLDAPDVAIALNAGLAVPSYEWAPTLRRLGMTPFFFTDYSEYSAERGAAFAQRHGMRLSVPVRLNPFRMPLRQGLVNGGSVGFPWVSNGFVAGFNT